jgi:hypothetical protein
MDKATMNTTGRKSAPVSGVCERCGCELSYLSSFKDGVWYCCGACAGSDSCTCGCKEDLARPQFSDARVPIRRMFASRHPDGLKTASSDVHKLRAFPFADPRRGR